MQRTNNKLTGLAWLVVTGTVAAAIYGLVSVLGFVKSAAVFAAVVWCFALIWACGKLTDSYAEFSKRKMVMHVKAMDKRRGEYMREYLKKWGES